MPLLVKYNGNWGDEMDVHGFFVTTQEKWDQYVQRVHKHFESNQDLWYGIGTNEEIGYESADDLLRDYRLLEITDEQAETLVNLFEGWRPGKVSFGFTGPDVE